MLFSLPPCRSLFPPAPPWFVDESKNADAGASPGREFWGCCSGRIQAYIIETQSAGVTSVIEPGQSQRIVSRSHH